MVFTPRRHGDGGGAIQQRHSTNHVQGTGGVHVDLCKVSLEYRIELWARVVLQERLNDIAGDEPAPAVERSPGVERQRPHDGSQFINCDRYVAHRLGSRQEAGDETTSLIQSRTHGALAPAID
jgi:hypothetical protein